MGGVVGGGCGVGVGALCGEISTRDGGAETKTPGHRDRENYIVIHIYVSLLQVAERAM